MGGCGEYHKGTGSLNESVDGALFNMDNLNPRTRVNEEEVYGGTVNRAIICYREKC